MEKKIIANGKNGTFEGKIKIHMNCDTKKITVTNHSTHDDSEKAIPLHKISASVNGEWWVTILDLDSEEKLEKAVLTLEKDLKRHIEFLANNTPVKSFTEKMKEKGYSSSND